MPMPWSYRHATKDWRAFLADARERLGTPTDNMTYTAVQGVLLTFRRRLTPSQATRFGQVLPAVLRAVFYDNWDPGSEPLPFSNKHELDAEVRALRPHHNLTPDDAIEKVAWALRRHVDQTALNRVLATFSPEAAAYWQVKVDDPRELERRIT